MRVRRLVARPAWLPLLRGEGWGEGELGRRTDPVGQNGFGMREAEPQILVALGLAVRGPSCCNGAFCRPPGGPRAAIFYSFRSLPPVTYATNAEATVLANVLAFGLGPCDGPA